MHNRLRLFIYIINKTLIYLSLAVSAYFLVMLLLNFDEYLFWLGRLIASLILYFVFKILFIIRKSRIPVAGLDYK